MLFLWNGHHVIQIQSKIATYSRRTAVHSTLKEGDKLFKNTTYNYHHIYIAILYRLKQHCVYHSLEGILVCYFIIVMSRTFLPQKMYTCTCTHVYKYFMVAIWDILVPVHQNCLHCIYKPIVILIPQYS